VRTFLRVVGAAFVVALVLAACTSNRTPASTTGASPSPAGSPATTNASPTLPATSAPPTNAPSPISTAGVVPADPDGFASVVARSVAAVVAAGRVEFVDRILNDAHDSSTCVPVPAIKVRSRADLDTERAYVGHAVRTARALKGIDGVGTARAKMQQGVVWPGVDKPFVVDVIIAVNCPDV
jgi:hypothetical protein